MIGPRTTALHKKGPKGISSRLIKWNTMSQGVVSLTFLMFKSVVRIIKDNKEESIDEVATIKHYAASFAQTVWTSGAADLDTS